MTRHVRPPADLPRLLRVLGPDPIRLRIDGTLVPLGNQGAVTIRRSKPARKALGDPAALSCQVVCATPPTWRDGAKVSVELSDPALTALYGPQWVGSNYTPNPSFEVNTSGWSAGVNTTFVRSTASPLFGTAHGRWTASANRATGTTMFSYNANGTMASGRVAAGQSWSGRVAFRCPGAAGQYIRVQLLAVNAAGADLGAVASRDVSVSGSPWTQVTIPSVATVPAGTTRLRWLVTTLDEVSSGAQLDVDAFHAHDSATPPTTYVDGSLAGYTDPTQGPISHSWEGTAHSSASHAVVTGRPTLWSEARYRFVGRIAPNGVRLATGRTGPAVAQLVATGTAAQLAMTEVGDVPWAAETVAARAARILDLAKVADPSLAYTLLSTATGPTMAARDVDRQPAAQLLEDLATATGPLAGLVERRDGSVAFGTVADATFPAAWLTDQVVPTQLDHEQAPRVNDVAVDLGSPPLGTILRENAIPNPGIEVDLTGWVGRNAAIVRDTGTFHSGAASLKITPTAGTADPGAYVQFFSSPGQRWRVKLKFQAALAGTYQLALQQLNAAGSAVLAQEQVNLDYVAGSGWVDIELVTTTPAPATTGMARAYLLRTPTASALATQVCWIDRVLAYDLAVPGADVADYFDGSTTATPQATYVWTGTAGKSVSRQVATDQASQVVIRTQDAASIAANGPASSTVKVDVDWTSTAAAYAYAASRGAAELLAGGWQAPEVEVDVLALLEDPADVVTTTPAGTTKRQLAAQLLRAELGSTRTWRRAVGDAPHVPPQHNVPARISGLDETITAHRWTVTTTAERTA